MRRQYHPHQTDRGMLIWDVHRLVELSANLPTFEIPLSKLSDFDQRSWFSGSEHPPTHKEVAFHAKLIKETDLKYPVILSQDGRVMDGMHRICKAWMSGAETIPAVQFETDPEPDYIDADIDSLPYDEPW